MEFCEVSCQQVCQVTCEMSCQVVNQMTVTCSSTCQEPCQFNCQSPCEHAVQAPNEWSNGSEGGEKLVGKPAPLIWTEPVTVKEAELERRLAEAERKVRELEEEKNKEDDLSVKPRHPRRIKINDD